MKYLPTALVLLVTLFFFQNCGGQFRSTNNAEYSRNDLLEASVEKVAGFAERCALADGLGARRSVVVAQMFDGDNAVLGLASVRLSQYSFRVLTDGSCSVREDFWTWSQAETFIPVGVGVAQVEGNQCVVSTAVRFDNPPNVRFGSYYVGDGAIAIAWSGTERERWRFSNKPTITRFELDMSTNQSRGSGWASKIGHATGVDFSRITKKNYVGKFTQNNYAISSKATVDEKTGMSINAYANCPNGSCFTFRHKIDGNPSTMNDNFILRGPGRMDFYNHQRDIVDGAVHPCIGVNGQAKGHLKPLLQILDDNSSFRGWVGVEASLWSPKYGHSIVGIQDLHDVP